MTVPTPAEILALPVTSSAAVGAVVPIPTFPLPKIVILVVGAESALPL